jgi:hypothetical protein
LPLFPEMSRRGYNQPPEQKFGQTRIMHGKIVMWRDKPKQEIFP